MRNDDLHSRREQFQPAPPLLGIVLTGGQSTRMGSDKAELSYHNKPQRVYLAALLSGFCDQVMISCNSTQANIFTDLNLLEDLFPKTGPMGALLSAFSLYPTCALITVPCDLPFLSEDIIRQLVIHRNPDKIATTFCHVQTKTIEPLVTIWEPAARSVLSEYFSNGIRSPYRVLIQSDIETVDVADTQPFKNVNTRDEYAGVLKMLRKL